MPARLKDWLHDGAEIALLDVREHGQYGEGHLFYAVPLPYSRLELDVRRLVPNRATRVVVYGDAATDVDRRALERLRALGYTRVHRLAGGARAWADAGMPLFKGVNVPSKTFGELVEHELGTPRISARELAERQAAGENLIVLDGRPFDEYRKMSIPGALCCPNGELALRIGELAPDPATTIVVNCAGRTRSIIGAQTLIDFGVNNRVLALENGTQGWYLVDLELQHGSTRRHGSNTAPADLEQRQRQARAMAARHGVPILETAQAQALLDDTTCTSFVLDVRTPEEFAAGTLPGARHAPGGQLLQATDQSVGVRGARLLLLDSDGVRAPVVAAWLRRMGHDAAVVREGIAAALRVPTQAHEPLAAPELLPIEPAELALARDAGQLAIIDLRPSMAFRQAHVPGSTWSIRPRLLDDALRLGKPLALVADEPALARIAASDLVAAGLAAPRRLRDGLAGWRAAGLPLASSPDTPANADCIDYLFFVHDRHDGNKAAARGYLAWETGLLAQLDERELAGFRIAGASAVA